MMNKSKWFSKLEYYPECMQLLTTEAQRGTSLGHSERLEMGKFLLHVMGGDVDLVKPYYQLMPDYREEKTCLLYTSPSPRD